MLKLDMTRNSKFSDSLKKIFNCKERNSKFLLAVNGRILFYKSRQKGGRLILEYSKIMQRFSVPNTALV